jgi:chaperone modulatory protein CbpM
MSDAIARVYDAVLIEGTVQLSFVELCRVCAADHGQVQALVDEGILTPIGDEPQDWRFADDSLRRARLALRLTRDLDLNPAGAAVVLDLLDEIEALRARLRRLGIT